MGSETDGLRRRLPGLGSKNEEARQTEGEGDGEGWSSVLVQVFPPYLCAGLGMVGAGLVLDTVQYWPVFLSMPELFILVPALIGLKGNLEMTLASRLSTHANLGELDSLQQMVELGSANLALIQVQGVVVGALASLLAITMSWLATQQTLDISRAVVLLASSVITASAASFLLGLVMVGVIGVSRKYNVNPDNVATPIAAALGDLVTLSLLAAVASSLVNFSTGLVLALLSTYLVITPLCAGTAGRNAKTSSILQYGWTPVLSAMIISSMGGKILNSVITTFPHIALFQPVINGVAGNLVGIQASRLSTDLHRTSKLGTRPAQLSSCNLLNPLYSFSPASCSFSPILSSSATAARVLLLLVVPGHLVFNLAIGLSQGFSVLSVQFLLLYLTAAVLQVGLLLHLASVMVHSMWTRGVDPDNSAIPYLTALGDLLGGAFLAVVFHLMDIVS